MKLPDNFADLPADELYEYWKKYGRSTKEWREKKAEAEVTNDKFEDKGYKTRVALPDDPCPRCGYFWLSTSWVYKLFGREDPFLPCCMAHDIEYGLKRKERRQVDSEFLVCAKKRSGKNLGLHAQARAYYSLIKVVGPFVW